MASVSSLVLRAAADKREEEERAAAAERAARLARLDEVADLL
jgi:hypothetical protein